MNIVKANKLALIFLLMPLVFITACISQGNKKSSKVEDNQYKFEKGTYGYDIAFFEKHNIGTIELKDEQSNAGVLLIPEYQGRVITSSSKGEKGASYGWINYELIESGEVNKQFNPYGGEERFWIGPEGGPFSIYFKQGDEQVFKNWVVPPVLDTEEFVIKEQDTKHVVFEKNTILQNASGTEFKVVINREVNLLDRAELSSLLNIEVPEKSFDVVAYESVNKITNVGEEAWTKKNGLLSIWMLCMFNPSPETTVFVPYETDVEGKIVNDEYFGKVPADRLIAEDGTVFFKIDGKYRSKIGIPPGRAKNLCGSFDSSTNVLTLLWCSLPDEPKEYVNSNWGDQENPYDGDVINSYNDGPVDGKIMGPFYEIETSSPAASLATGESMTHVQRVVHIQGEKDELAKIVNKLFNLDLNNIESKFTKD